MPTLLSSFKAFLLLASTFTFDCHLFGLWPDLLGIIGMDHGAIITKHTLARMWSQVQYPVENILGRASWLDALTIAPY